MRDYSLHLAASRPAKSERSLLKKKNNENQMKIKWHDKPQKHDYPAAASYLSLSMDQQAATTATEELRNAEMTKFAA